MEDNNDKSVKENRELMNLILGRKGGETTIRIIDQLLERPYNINQLSKIPYSINFKVSFYIKRRNRIWQSILSYKKIEKKFKGIWTNKEAYQQ